MTSPHPMTAHPLLSQLRENCRRLRAEGQAVLAAVSGGPDSVALLLGLAELRAERNLNLFAAHVHHGWRGAEADADAAWVVELGRRLGIPTEILAVTPEHKSQLAGKSLEEGAREVRYRLLTTAAEQHGCTLVAVGHTADDQAETVLHHILRGTGLAGLSGMPAERPLTDRIRLIRPLLDVSRADLMAFLTDRQQTYRVDVTNADVALTRNRLRHELLPLLRDQFNPQVETALLRLAQQASEAVAVLEDLAEKLLADALLEDTEAVCRLDVHRLASQPDALIRQTLRRLWIRRNWPRQEMGQREWQRLSELIRDPGAIDLPGGLAARRDAGPLVIRRR